MVTRSLAVLVCASLLVSSTTAEEAEAEVTLIEADWNGVEKVVAGHRGKVVLVDIWTTTCPICIRELPAFLALRKRFGDRVVLVTVNCDYDGVPGKPPRHYRKGVLEVLGKLKATATNVQLTRAFIDFLDDVELASTPAVFVYGPGGRLAKRFDNDEAVREEDEFRIPDVERFVGVLLGDETSP